MIYFELRNRHFLAQAKRLMAETPPGAPFSLPDIARRTAESQPPQYYLDFDHALRHLRAWRRCRKAGCPLAAGARKWQWEDLSQAVAARQRATGMSDSRALALELATGRPACYYMTPQYALRLLRALLQHQYDLKNITT